MIRHKTFRGEEFNMSAFVEKNGSSRAIGNVSMNARGDIVDKDGKVKATAGQISKGLSNIDDKRSKTVSLKDDAGITPVQQTQIKPDLDHSSEADILPTVIAKREIETTDGIAVEVEYSDGSFEIIKK